MRVIWLIFWFTHLILMPSVHSDCHLCAAQVVYPEDILQFGFARADTVGLTEPEFLSELKLRPSFWYIHGSVTGFSETIRSAAKMARNCPDLQIVMFAWPGGRHFLDYGVFFYKTHMLQQSDCMTFSWDWVSRRWAYLHACDSDTTISIERSRTEEMHISDYKIHHEFHPATCLAHLVWFAWLETCRMPLSSSVQALQFMPCLSSRTYCGVQVTLDWQLPTLCWILWCGRTACAWSAL